LSRLLLISNYTVCKPFLILQCPNICKKGEAIETSEHKIIYSAAQGNTKAFRQIVEKYKKKIYYLAYDLTGSHHNAEDLSQEVFIKAFLYIKNFRGDSNLGSWLYRITINTFLSQTNRKSYKTLRTFENIDQINWSDSGFAGGTESPEKSAESALMKKNISAALERLAKQERSIFVLRYFQQLSIKEISDLLNVKIGTVKSTIHRALKKMQKALDFYRER